MKNHHGNGILGTEVSVKVLGPGIVITNLGGIESMKFQYSTFHTWIL